MLLNMSSYFATATPPARPRQHAQVDAPTVFFSRIEKKMFFFSSKILSPAKNDETDEMQRPISGNFCPFPKQIAAIASTCTSACYRMSKMRSTCSCHDETARKRTRVADPPYLLRTFTHMHVRNGCAASPACRRTNFGARRTDIARDTRVEEARFTAP